MARSRIAPLVEEIVFRGYMHRGLAASRLGPVGAVLITAAVWAVVHIQYDWFDIGLIFGLGILLGVLRQWTGSLWSVIAVHLMVNVVAMGLMLYYILAGIVEV